MSATATATKKELLKANIAVYRVYLIIGLAVVGAIVSVVVAVKTSLWGILGVAVALIAIYYYYAYEMPHQKETRANFRDPSKLASARAMAAAQGGQFE